ncbi:hypothetical protein [Micromonospora avicenniae]|uniref:DUF3800 domain-containing protein n=1 Tax=Micromonospora avicenniae TaxID=1198245 RepID=A0A1N6UMA6_9ACTN|nr:hypothetical protein [Micromonospora avicenniae]SIQ66778.1 hypothetical protein SAMN05444858_103418 [Micromonospora avicenniae]
MSAHVFVDETKERGLLIAAAVVLTPNLSSARKVMRSLVLPSQRRIHFHKERDDRRRQIVGAINGLGVQAVILDASNHPNMKVARDACLVSLVAYAAKINAARLVIERDDSTLKADRRLLFDEVQRAGLSDTLRYDHLRAHEECLLAIPDALAWCWAKRGRWRAAVQRTVVESHQL